jgi:hypothetical protein
MLAIRVNIVTQALPIELSQVFPKVLSKKLPNHQKNDYFDLSGAHLSYSKQVKAVSIAEKDKSTSLQVLGFLSIKKPHLFLRNGVSSSFQTI